MPVFPTKHFNTGNPNLDNQLRRLARSVQTAHPVGTGTTRINRTPTGTAQRFNGSRRRTPIGGSNGLDSWQIYQHSFNSSTKTGLYYVHTGLIVKPDTAVATFCSNDDSTMSPLAISVGASVTDHLVWIDMTISISSGVISLSSQALADGTSGWTGYPATMNSAGTHWFYLVGSITTDSNGNPTYYQQIFDTIFLPSLVPDPTVSPNPDSNGCWHICKVT